MSAQQIAEGAFEWTDVGMAYVIAAEFGQDPIAFAQRLAHEPRWLVDQLAWFVSLREAKRARLAVIAGSGVGMLR